MTFTPIPSVKYTDNLPSGWVVVHRETYASQPGVVHYSW